ncbi:MAG: hypothetical protein JST47_01035 [Bacteroidetes bacterium]|nr:hypothetical protein [Bacteroidota bacterium]
MPKEVPILSQFRHERDTWKRLLMFAEEENNILKNRIAEVVISMSNNSKALLEKLDEFQNAFIMEDRIIMSLKNEINEKNRLLNNDFYKNDSLFIEAKKQQKIMRTRIEETEAAFNKLKINFNAFLGETL